jgi:hypothetical protein
MSRLHIRELGEYRPGSFNSLNLNKLKEFVVVPYYIDWYKSRESKKVYPLFIQEIESLNPTSFRLPGIIGRNPFFDHAQIKFFIAYDGERPVGRLISFIDYNYNKKYDDIFGWVGLFESVENRHVAEMLFGNAIDYLKEYGCSRIMGPAKFNAGGEVGLLIDGFENVPYFMEPYNAPYYKDFFEGYGFKKENDWYSIITDSVISKNYMERIERILNKISLKNRSNFDGVNIRCADFGDYKNEIIRIRELYNDLWDTEKHPQQVRLTDEEFDYIAMGIKAISLEDLIFIIEKHGEPIGVSVNFPDINEIIYDYDNGRPHQPSKRFLSGRDLVRDIKIFNLVRRKLKYGGYTRFRSLILGIKKEYRRNGIESRVYSKINTDAVKLGFRHASGSQLADINLDIVNPISRLGKVAFTWRVYGLDV